MKYIYVFNFYKQDMTQLLQSLKSLVLRFSPRPIVIYHYSISWSRVEGSYATMIAT